MSKEALKVMADWVAAIADNVKNPIAGIGAVLDRVQSNLDKPELVGDSVGQIRKRLGALNEYVTELADFARPASLKPCLVKVGELLVQAVEAADLPPGCTVDVDLDGDLALHIDAGKVTLVLKSLLRNAFEAIDAHAVPHLRLAAWQAEEATVGMSVDDNGRGMAPDQALRALEPFFTTKEAGTGLGLAIARKYVEAHGGTLTIEKSVQLGGCRIVLLLPRAAAEGQH